MPSRRPKKRLPSVFRNPPKTHRYPSIFGRMAARHSCLQPPTPGRGSCSATNDAFELEQFSSARPALGVSPCRSSRRPPLGAVDNAPTASTARYYALRASAGLLVIEGTSPSVNGLGYPRIPGVFSDAQVAGWRGVADAVHAAGGRIF
jgi:hypothetical protein